MSLVKSPAGSLALATTAAFDNSRYEQATARREVLLRLLDKRFGPLPADLVARVRDGSIDDLDRWADRVVEVATLAGVFATA